MTPESQRTRVGNLSDTRWVERHTTTHRMLNERMTSLALGFIHQDVKVEVEDVMKEFAKKNRRLKLDIDIGQKEGLGPAETDTDIDFIEL